MILPSLQLPDFKLDDGKGRQVPASKGLTLHRLPAILVIHLGRFDHTDTSGPPRCYRSRPVVLVPFIRWDLR